MLDENEIGKCIRLKIRSLPNQKCTVCNVCNDTTEHMTHYIGNPSESIQTMLGHTLPQENGLQWLFHPDRMDNVRSWTSRWIKARRAYREKRR